MRKRRPKPCPHCGEDTRAKFTISVSAKAYALFQAGAEARGWSIRQLVEEATR